MPSDLSQTSTSQAFETFIEGLAKQHMRVKVRNHFGLNDGTIDEKAFAKSAVFAEPDKIVQNLLQEQPETVNVVRITGTSGTLRAVSLEAPGTITVGELFSTEEAEQALVITGAKAQLCAYRQPGTENAFVRRVVLPEPEKEEKLRKTAPRRRVRTKTVARRRR